MQILFTLLTSIQTIYITGKKNLTPFCCFSIPLSRADTVTWQERSVALHTMLGKCSGTTGKRVNASLPGQELEKGDNYSSAECTFLSFCEAHESCRGETSGLRRAAGSAAGCAGTPHYAQPRPLSQAPKLPRSTRFSAEQGAGGAPWPSSLPSQPSSCMAVIRHPEHTLLRSLSASSFLLQPGYGLISNTNNFLKKEMAPIGTKSPLVSPSAVALLLSAISPFSSLSFTATVL